MIVKNKHGNEYEKATVDRDIEFFSNTVQDLIEMSGCCDIFREDGELTASDDFIQEFPWQLIAYNAEGK